MLDTTRCIITLRQRGYSVTEIKSRWLEKDIFVGLVPICKLLIEEKWPCLKVSIASNKRACKNDLGWARTHPKHCQLIRVANTQR